VNEVLPMNRWGIYRVGACGTNEPVPRPGSAPCVPARHAPAAAARPAAAQLTFATLTRH